MYESHYEFEFSLLNRSKIGTYYGAHVGLHVVRIQSQFSDNTKN